VRVVILLGGCLTCEELVEFTQRSECHFLKLNGAKVAHF